MNSQYAVPDQTKTMYNTQNHTEQEKHWTHSLCRCSPYCWYAKCCWSVAVTEFESKWLPEKTNYAATHTDWLWAKTTNSDFNKAQIHDQSSPLSTAWFVNERAQVASARDIKLGPCETFLTYICADMAYAQVYDEVTHREKQCNCCC